MKFDMEITWDHLLLLVNPENVSDKTVMSRLWENPRDCIKFILEKSCAVTPLVFQWKKERQDDF